MCSAYGLYVILACGVADTIMKQYQILKYRVHLPMAKLRAPQTRHCILQILAEVKDILHSSLPLGLGVCGSVMQSKRL